MDSEISRISFPSRAIVLRKSRLISKGSMPISESATLMTMLSPDSGHLQNIAADGEKMVAALQHSGDIVPTRLSQSRIPLEKLGKVERGIHRRPYLAAHVGLEGALATAGDLGGSPRPQSARWRPSTSSSRALAVPLRLDLRLSAFGNVPRRPCATTGSRYLLDPDRRRTKT